MHTDINFNKQKECRYGTMLYNTNDTYVGTSFDLYGEFSEGEAESFKQIIKKGYTVLDIGANIGAHTLLFANLVGIEGEIHAFEPQRIVFQTLCANMALNNIVKAYCYNEAVGDIPDSLLVPQIKPWVQTNFGGLSLGNHKVGENVKVTTVDGLNLSNCHFIKIDVEGMEINVLKGAANTITKYNPILYVENDRSKKANDLIRYIASLDYDMYWHQTFLFNSKNYFNNPENVFGDISSINMICIPKSYEYKIEGFQRVDIPPG